MQFLCTNLTSTSHGVDMRFGEPLTSDDIEHLNESIKSKNTSQRNKWALKMFNEWLQVRHPDFFKSVLDFSVDEINEYGSRFIHEVSYYLL